VEQATYYVGKLRHIGRVGGDRKCIWGSKKKRGGKVAEYTSCIGQKERLSEKGFRKGKKLIKQGGNREKNPGGIRYGQLNNGKGW